MAEVICGTEFGLNPFEIRGGLKPGKPVEVTLDLGLNPFEIRGGLKLDEVFGVSKIQTVLIPLKSGVA